MSDFDLLTDDEYRQLIRALGGQELFVCQNTEELLQGILGSKANDFIRRFRGDRIYIKKHMLEQIRRRQLDYIQAVRDKCQTMSISQAIKQTALEFGISERWGYELYARFKGGRLVQNSRQMSLF